MDVYYHVKFQLCIIIGSKVSRDGQNYTPPRNRMCSDPPRNRVNKLNSCKNEAVVINLSKFLQTFLDNIFDDVSVFRQKMKISGVDFKIV